MPLSSGSRLGPYEILAPLGAGGMGEVYRAADTKLKREVAIKVLPEGFSFDHDRMARFEREAQVLASLNHPNIAAIHGLEESSGVRALVMELVEGSTLAERIAPGPIPLDEAMHIAEQIAEGLEYAHEHGIIHRDLKPANIKITREGAVKILDFGLAKALEGEASPADISKSPTISIAATRAGMILGTAAYMSPEQAKGKSVDRRTDIWAFGCVLFEMLTGKPAFSGETVTDTLAAVVRAEPDWALLSPHTPTALRKLLERCLQKDSKQRLRDIGDGRLALEESLSAPSDATAADGAALVRPQPMWRRVLPWALAGALVIALAFAVWRKPGGPAGQPLVQFSIGGAPGESLALVDNPAVAISPDGGRVAYVVTRGGGSQIYLRDLNHLEAMRVPGTEKGLNPSFSPDGKWLAFFADGTLKRVPLAGGPVEKICDVATDTTTRGASWGPDGNIYLSPHTQSGLMRVSAVGGTLQQLTSLDIANGERTHRWPQVLPGGKTILFTVGKQESPEFYDESEIDAVSIATGKRKVVLRGASMARYVSTGHLLYARGGQLFAAPFDLGRLEVTGQAVSVLQGVNGDPTSGASHFSISDQGALVYVAGASAGMESALAWADEKGSVEMLDAPVRRYRDTRLSPDGRYVAVSIPQGKSLDIWIYDIANHTLNRLTFEADNQKPFWTPDGKRVIFFSTLGGQATEQRLYWKPADGSGAAARLLEDTVSTYAAVSPDGKTLAYTPVSSAGRSGGIWTVSIGGDRKPAALISASAQEISPAFSPNGDYIAYTAFEGSTRAVYVQPYPPTGGRWQVSAADNGLTPQWSRDGKKLFYRAGNTIMVVPIETKPSFKAGTPRKYLTDLTLTPGAVQNYSVAPDGRRLLVTRPAEKAAASSEVVVIVNWGEELRRLAPNRR